MTSGGSWAGVGSQSIGMLLGWSYANGFTASNNVITSSGYGMGIMAFGVGTAAKQMTISGNTITGVSSTRTTTGDGTGIYIADEYLLNGTDRSESYVNLTGNTISGFVRGIEVDNTPTSTQPITVIAHNNAIVGNTIGIYASTLTTEMDATNNWWGAADGPSTVGPGSGDAVSTMVNYYPWYISSDMGTLYTPTPSPTPTPTPTPTPAPTYSISLTSTSAANELNTGDTVYDAAMNLAGLTTVELKASYLSPTLQTTTVNLSTKEASFANVEEGNYVIVISRNGYLKRSIDVTVSGADVSLGNKPLIAGDVYVDGLIDGSDTEKMFTSIGLDYSDTLFDVVLDLNLDGILDGTDTETQFSSLGANVNTYGETVNYGL